jgi:hypothetical protein
MLVLLVLLGLVGREQLLEIQVLLLVQALLVPQALLALQVQEEH